MARPAFVRWTDHALVKAQMLGIARTDVERVVFEGHEQRQRNAGAAEWRVTSRTLVVVYDHPTRATGAPQGSSRSGVGGSLPEAMKIDGHYDREADIAWLRFEGFDAHTVISEETQEGLRDVDPSTGATVGLEVWRASERLPADLLGMLPPPPVGVPA